ncbi:MAG: hypothetical protein DHS20C12_11970 [Pseudohongiella sp.]|nr:MAG: hypothetical protein DHS20C12_11970 [Pseudohongiella sp.]
MAQFVVRKNRKFKLTFDIMQGNENMGSVTCEFDGDVTNDEFNDLIEDQGERKALERVLVGVDPLETEDGETLSPEQCMEFMLSDMSASAAAMANFMEAKKSSQFRKAAARKRR